MASMGIQLLGCILALIGWVGVIFACALPMWRVTAFIGTNIVTSQIFWYGIWMSCAVQSTGQMQCKAYDSMLALTTDLQAARALVVVSLVLGLIGLCITFTAGKCTHFIKEETTKKRSMLSAGVLFIISGVLCLIPASWTASIIIRDFYNPVLVDAQRRELGASLYIGWGAGLLLIMGGALLCSSCPPRDDQGPSLKYQTVKKHSSAPSHITATLRSDSPTCKTYI
ncbi:claudin-4-like [Brachyhypopomus gauderio]|uniref:claudin-4-like n=1 Tax=Brachyhypopomus gauderio TaxID=698409 RepID=UPI0040434F71